MLLGFVLLFGSAFLVWLVFFKFRWLKFSIAWGFFSTFFALHLLIIFLIGLRFVTPLATEARVIQHTIQLVPRLPEPTLVTAVLVEPNVPVKKGQPLFQFDRRPYEYKVKQLEAQLAKAKQDVLVLKADTQINAQKIARLTAELQFAKYQQKLTADLAGRARARRKTRRMGRTGRRRRCRHQGGAGRGSARAAALHVRIGGVNTTVAAVQAELDQARYYLDNTLMVAPEDGTHQPAGPSGMVSGDIRYGAIASFIVDADRYLLANYFQENLKYVKPGRRPRSRSTFIRADLPGKVEAIWQGNGQVRCCRAAPCRTSTTCRRKSRRDSSPWRSASRGISRGFRSAPRAGRRSTPIRRVPSSSCARSVSGATHGSTGSIRSPADARTLVLAVAALAGCALKAPPTHTEVSIRPCLDDPDSARLGGASRRAQSPTTG